jgi:hypothetical protein
LEVINMRTRTVYIVVYYRNADNVYTREAMTPERMEDFKKYGDHFLYFDIQSDENLKTINETWYAEIDTMHPELIDWTQPEFPVMAGCIRRGRERSQPITTARVCYTHDICPECFGVVCPHYREEETVRD